MSNKRNRNRRAQTPKVGNRRLMEGMQELRQGSRTTPVPSGTAYNRNKERKHRGRGWSNE